MYTSAAGTINYSYDYENETPTDAVTIDGETVLSSKYSYDSESNIATKTLYYEHAGEIVDLIVCDRYDENGNLYATGYNTDETYTNYSYDNNNQLTRVDSLFNNYTSTYIYDKRGNITSKSKYDYTEDEVITSKLREKSTFSYDNEQWLDQLTAVNGTPLTYDANGNLASYGDTAYTWSHGKWLSSVKDGENTYTYRYDENGIRAEKYVNGVKTEFNTLNGVLLSQKTGDDFIYFQYDTNGTLIGFVYNDTQYLYMTNQLGDVLSITDAQGREVVEYEYDEWGNPLETTLMMDGEIASKIAEINPFRYRGYYYDNETGMYYLQSRYYNPELGRFISADDFGFINSKLPINLNAYAYCRNNPIKYIDPTGYVSELGISIANIITSIFILDDALELSEDFAYYIAGIISLEKDKFFEKSKMWYLLFKSDFKGFLSTDLYSQIKLLDADIFKDFYINAKDNGKSILTKDYGSLKVTIEYINKSVSELFKEQISKLRLELFATIVENIQGAMTATFNEVNIGYETKVKIMSMANYCFIRTIDFYKTNQMNFSIETEFYYYYPEPLLEGVITFAAIAIIIAVIKAMSFYPAKELGGLIFV